MEKVKVTQEQADAIEHVLKYKEIDHIINLHTEDDRPWKSNWTRLNDFDAAQLARALHKGYEIELEFKVDDWVKSKLGKGIGKVMEVTGNGWIYTDFGLSQMSGQDVLRHATDEEIATEKTRRWWEVHGRDVLELRKGDLVRELGSNIIERVLSVSGGHIDTSHDDLSFHRFVEDCRVVCFVEDLKDI